MDEVTQDINNIIKVSKKTGTVNTKQISDTHHTYGQLYEQRLVLFSVICNTYKHLAWKSKKHFDEENDPMFNGDFIAGINTPNGVATYHIKLKYWDLFDVKEIERAPQYDGSSPEEIMKRILSLNNIGSKSLKRK